MVKEWATYHTWVFTSRTGIQARIARAAEATNIHSVSKQITKAHIIKQMLLFSVVSLPVASCILLIHARHSLAFLQPHRHKHKVPLVPYNELTKHSRYVVQFLVETRMWDATPTAANNNNEANKLRIWYISCVSWMVARNPCDEKITIKTTDKIQNQFWWHIVLWSWAHEPRIITHALRVGTDCTQRMGWICGAERWSKHLLCIWMPIRQYMREKGHNSFMPSPRASWSWSRTACQLVS